MPAPVIDVSAAEDPRDIVHRAVQSLAEGKLVVFPTETVYVVAAGAQNELAVQRLAELRKASSPHPLTMALRSAVEAMDYVPNMTPLGARLARRCWPGPVILEVPDQHPESVVRRLPPAIHKAFCPQGSLRLRVPAHPLIAAVQKLISGPLAISAANMLGEPEATTAQQAAQLVGGEVDLILDDGKSRFGQSSSVVRVDEQGLHLLRGGVITELNLRRLASWMVVLVCTGNTCRSPMAEMLMRKRLAAKLGCSLADLEDHGVGVMSAGVAAGPGGRAAAEAIEIMKEHDLDLSLHETQPLTDRVVRFADLILTMTRGHRDAVISQWPEAADRVKLISNERGDVSDPIGGPTELYRRCAQQMDEYLADWLEQLNIEKLPPTGSLETGPHGN